MYEIRYQAIDNKTGELVDRPSLEQGHPDDGPAIKLAVAQEFNDREATFHDRATYYVAKVR